MPMIENIVQTAKQTVKASVDSHNAREASAALESVCFTFVPRGCVRVVPDCGTIVQASRGTIFCSISRV
jgi:hypothetical protein